MAVYVMNGISPMPHMYVANLGGMMPMMMNTQPHVVQVAQVAQPHMMLPLAQPAVVPQVGQGQGQQDSASKTRKPRSPRVGHSGDKRTGRSPPRNSDWICKSCQNCNWESRMWCKRCGTTRPKYQTPVEPQTIMGNAANRPLIVPTTPMSADHRDSIYSTSSGAASLHSSHDDNDEQQHTPKKDKTQAELMFDEKLRMLVQAANAAAAEPTDDEDDDSVKGSDGPSRMLSLLQIHG
eukprot:TRINITY_DN21169_c0_g1_i1.p1 TRINITY_DN21169_c0_g1~~TRINITY_DN21169_c0_g1_i1.p1  ORF type:complete len:273 (+),score=42.79 TRINITY_DN21169_c0_g1_i1:112-819(+)